MSQLAETRVVCPGCQAERVLPLLESLNGDVLPHQVDAIADGTYELMTCESCERRFQPEHRMLLAQFRARSWIVMQPRTDRPRYATIEQEVQRILEREFADAAPVVGAGLRGVRPRLVFGHHMLAEAVRAN